MKITAKTLMVQFEHNIQVGHNNAIEATLLHQAFIFKNKDGNIDLDLDFMDVTNVKFMGMPIEDGYKGFKKFKETMMTMGIDVDKLIDGKAAELITDEDMETLKAMFRLNVG